MNAVEVLVETIWNIMLLVPKTLLAILPLYNTLSSFKQNLIAMAFGVSPFLIWIVLKGFKLIVRFWRQ